MVVSDPVDRDASAMLVTWLSPDDEVSTRWRTIADDLLEQAEERDGPTAIQRTDVELGGHSVVRLVLPSVEAESAEWDFPDDFDQLSEDEQEAVFAEFAETSRNARQIVTGHRAALLLRESGRWIAFWGLESYEDEIPDSEWDTLSREMLQLLEPADGPTLAGQIRQHPAMGTHVDLPGLPMLELVGNAAPIINVLSDHPDHPQARAIIDRFGLSRLSLMGLKWSLDNHTVRATISCAAPAPRDGILQWIDQREVEARPAAWVPSDVLQYQHISFDLGKAYATLKDLIIEQFGDQASTVFRVAETQVLGNTPVLISRLCWEAWETDIRSCGIRRASRRSRWGMWNLNSHRSGWPLSGKFPTKRYGIR